MGIIERCMRQSTDCLFISYIISVFSLTIYYCFTQKLIWLDMDLFNSISIFAICFLLGYQFLFIKTILPNIQPMFEKYKALFNEDQFQEFSQELGRKIQFYKLNSLMIIAFFTLMIYESTNMWKCELGMGCPIYYIYSKNNPWSYLLDIYNVIVYYLIYFLLIVILWIMINLTLIFIELKNEKYKLNIDIYDLTKIKELKHLKSYIIFILINYIIVISLIIISDLRIIPLLQKTHPLLDNIKIIIISSPFEMTMLALMLLIGIILFITTQKTIHKLVENSANIELIRISQKHKEICDKITDTSYNKKNSDDKNTLEELQITLDILEKEETRIKQIIGKYFDIKLLISVLATILIPLIGLAIQTWIAYNQIVPSHH